MAQQLLAPIYILIITFLISIGMVRFSISLARVLDILDHPVGGKTHKQPMPLLGGFGMLLALGTVIGFHALVLLHGRHWFPSTIQPYLPNPNLEAWDKLLVIGGGAILITLLGVFDDKVQLSVKIRILIQFLIALGVVCLGVRPTLAHVSDLLAVPLTLLWIFGITNAFNLVDGLDGLAGTLAAVAATIFMIFMIITGQIIVAAMLAAVLGAVFGFLVWNWHPAQTYMGSGGSLLLGYLLATIPLVSDFMQHHRTSLAPVLLPFLVLSVPVYDTLSVMALRMGHGRSPFKSDHNHLAHRLRRLGLSVRQTVSAMGLLGLSTGLMSLLLLDAEPFRALLIISSVGAMFAVFVILERVHLAHHDSERLVNIPVRLWINMPVDMAEGPHAYECSARLASVERIELEMTGASSSLFAEAMASGRTVTLELHPDPDTKGEGPLVILCSLRSVWKSDIGTAFIGLAPMFEDPAARSAAEEWIRRRIYPGR